MAVVLAGDVGGTNTRLGYFEARGGGLTPLEVRTFKSRAYPGLLEVIAELRRDAPRPIDAAAIGIAGPVRQGRVPAPNLSWPVVDALEVASALGLPSVTLVNDLAAHAHGISYLGEGDVELLHPGRPEAHGHLAIISAGTGLGQAGLFWDGQRHRPFASEGGHVDFAPHDALEVALFEHLVGSGHVSVERLVSGPGLRVLYEFLRDSGRGQETDEVRQALAAGDPAAVIAQRGLSRSDPLCTAALDRFVSLYGAAAGNVALQFFATGGVYVGGGIAPRIRERLREGAFVEAFLAKGRLRGVLEEIPVRLITNDQTALWGAAHVAAFGA
jgi:glucokinase